MTLKFKTNINCANCLSKVEPFLNEVKNIKWTVDTTVPQKILSIDGENLDKSKIVLAVEDAGFDIEELID